MERNMNMKIQRLNMKRKPFVPFGTMPEGMKQLGSRCPKNCVGRNFQGFCPIFCRADAKARRNSRMKDLVSEIRLRLNENAL